MLFIDRRPYYFNLLLISEIIIVLRESLSRYLNDLVTIPMILFDSAMQCCLCLSETNFASYVMRWGWSRSRSRVESEDFAGVGVGNEDCLES